MIVRLLEAAYDDLIRIEDWLDERSPRAARKIVAQILDQMDRLADFPFLGHPGRVDGTCEWIVARSPYIIVYRIVADPSELQVIGVFHAAQDRDESKR